MSSSLASTNVTEVFTAFGEQGVKAERVAANAAKQVREYLKADVPIGPYLADQLMLPLAISVWQKGELRGGSYRTLPLSRHATTHIDLLREFLGVTIDVEQSPDGGCCSVRITRSST